MLLCSFDWTDRISCKHGRVDAALEPKLLVSIVLDLGDVSINLLFVKQVVFRDGGSQLCRISEDLSPLFDRGDVIVHALASRKSLGEDCDGETELESGLDLVISAALLKIVKGQLEEHGHLLASLVACLNLDKVVITGHTVDEASNEVWNSLSIEVGDLVLLLLPSGVVGLNGANSRNNDIS